MTEFKAVMNFSCADSSSDTLVEEMEISTKSKRKSPHLIPENSKRRRHVEDAGKSLTLLLSPNKKPCFFPSRGGRSSYKVLSDLLSKQ